MHFLNNLIDTFGRLFRKLSIPIHKMDFASSQQGQPLYEPTQTKPRQAGSGTITNFVIIKRKINVVMTWQVKERRIVRQKN